MFLSGKTIIVIEKRVPRKLKKLYPSMEMAISLYAFHDYAHLAKRSRVWLIKEGDKMDLVYNRLICKPFILTWAELCEKHANNRSISSSAYASSGSARKTGLGEF